MKTSESIVEIAKALAAFQGAVRSPKATTENPFFKSKYATLNQIQDAIREEALKNGLAIIQSAGGNGEGVTITTRVIHTSGEWIEAYPLVLTPDKPTPQGAGSAITYGRRYALSAILGISSEDDDDANAAEPEKEEKKRPPAKSITQTAVYRKMMATAKDVFADYNEEERYRLLHEHMEAAFGVTSSKDLNAEQISLIIEWLEGWKE